jgi:outer membrane receptor for Fe3+-dicitrate
MAKPFTCGMLLLATTLTGAGALVRAAETTEAAVDNTSVELDTEESVDIELPGIVVTASRDRNVQRAATEVVSVLSAEDLERTGDGDIASALARVTGLSVTGGGFVYVRGLGDRYSQALLNGLPLPSPEPLRRAVPLDLFPTDIIASSLVQKTFSPNFPGEFGGGVINLTTLAVPKAPFLKLGFGISGDSETTGRIGYDYYGGQMDWTGYDSGVRDTPPALAAFFASGERLSAGNVDGGDIAKQFVNSRNGVVQTIDRIQPDLSGSLTGGTSWQLASSELGLIMAAGFNNKWRTRDNIEQTPGSFDLSVIDKDYRTVSTENRVVTNALFGLGYQTDAGARLRWTNLYVHDTLKRASLAEGKENAQRAGFDFRTQSTGWYERQLMSTQLTGGIILGNLSANARASLSTSKRDAPFELGIKYSRSNAAASPFGNVFINRLDNGQTGYAQATFSDLQEDLRSAGVDFTLDAIPGVVLTAGYDIADTERDSQRREFQVLAPSDFPSEVGMLRPDYLLGSAVIEYYDIGLVETTETAPAFTARLLTRAAFTQLQADLGHGLELGAGVRFERGLQEVSPLQVFDTAPSLDASTRLVRDYYLPAATLTWKFAEGMQVRTHVSRTIARPQFRELMFQTFYDPEANRSYRGNPLMVDSKFLNAEARYEWYFDAGQRFSVAGFYKQIDRPIEAFTGFNDNVTVTSFANAPKATLYGLETEVQKFFPLGSVFENAFLAARRAVVIGNYTWSNSKLKVGAGDTVSVFGTATQPATNFFVNGSPLTGQSDHLVNLQLGLESDFRLSQQTILLSYSSDRVTSRGPAGLPDINESPGLMVDLVAREGIELLGRELELKFEARNLFGRGYKEFQKRDGNEVYYNRYAVGTSFSMSVSTKF